ncbi:MAG: lipoprotein [Candidatus Heimdallarchaeum aukensis]|uniref:Lipoprotein n=1 Tax=Candidatus Heimdallarchaeum aukensis TaxID=2876573 RepID=A0A9Y1FMT1_9ARCH|nr:MAG: lipoprotein [Candidatus Heimdallarchaeum aukensis]
MKKINFTLVGLAIILSGCD